MATCRCINGHTWHTRVIEDDPDTNAMVVEIVNCPTCASDDMEIIDVETDYDEDDHSEHGY